MPTTQTSFTEHMRAKFGPVWVVARRTKNIVRQYGTDVVTLTPAAFQAERAAWQEQQA